MCDYYFRQGEKEKKQPDLNAKSIVTNALPLISRNSFPPTSCQRATRHSKDYATSQRHLVRTFQYPYSYCHYSFITNNSSVAICI